MKVVYKGRLVEASELRDPDATTISGYEISGVGVVPPYEVTIPSAEVAQGEVQPPSTHAKSKRGADPSVK